MSAFCTIISPDYLPFVECLRASISKFIPNVELHVLVTGASGLPAEKKPGFHFYEPRQIQTPQAQAILKKYEGTHDPLRWSLKPAFLQHLLQQHEKMIYVDCDIFFFADPSFLFGELETASVILTPHHAATDPFAYPEKFMMNFLAGLFNAGFIGVNRSSIKTLEWWSTACLFRTEIDMANGFHMDQRYLDLIPVIDPNARIVRHRGCNIGSWNMESWKREQQPDGSVLINGKYPVVFVHFNYETIRHILNGDDKNLKPYYEEYENCFSKTGFTLHEFIKDLNTWKQSGFFIDLKRRTTVRTRIKRWLFGLAKKL